MHNQQMVINDAFTHSKIILFNAIDDDYPALYQDYTTHAFNQPKTVFPPSCS